MSTSAIPKPRQFQNITPAAPGEVRNPTGVNQFTSTSRAAREMLRAHARSLVEMGLELCEKVSGDAPPCPMCGRGMPRPEEMRLKAIIAMLDRAGLGPKSTITVEEHVTMRAEFSFVHAMTGDELAEVNAVLERAKARIALLPDAARILGAVE